MTGKTGWLFAFAKGRFRVFWLAIFVVVAFGSAFAETKPTYPSLIAVTLTNALQVRQLAARQENSSCSVRLEGIVLRVSPAQDRLILQDDSGGVVVKMDLRNQTAVEPGQKVLIEGSCRTSRGEIVAAALVNNDGIHPASEKSGTLFLSAGLHPISVEWFNGPANFALDVNCMGPEMPRQRIPEAALFRTEMDLAGGTNRLMQGLDYRSYEGSWDRLPDFSQLPVLKRGIITNFDLQARPRDTNVALVFSGYFEAPQEGEYEFWLKSDDGSKLYIGDRPLRLSILGKATWPAPHLVSPGQFVSEEQECQWSEVEGVVSRVSEVYGGVSVELTSGAGHAYLKVMEGNYNSLGLLLHIRVRATGISQNASAIDGQTVPCLLVPDLKEIAIVEMAPAHWADCPVRPIHSLVETNFSEATGTIIHVSGIVCSNSSEKFLTIQDSTGRILLETLQMPPQIGDRVEALGWWSPEGGNVILRGGFYQKILQKVNNDTNGLPLLTKAIQVKRLSRKEAQRGYPVRIQGVITARVGIDFVIQDSTWSVFSYWNGLAMQDLPEIGDYWEIEGKSSVDFAPNIVVQRAVYLRPGILPEPIRPNQDELINGSLDTQYIEVQGIATTVETNTVTLLTRAGKVRLLLNDLKPNAFTGLENALIRIRGVGSPDRDTNQMILPVLAPLRLFNALVSVDEPAPSHPFETPLKHASDLLLFDARADALRRVRIAGQVLSERQGEYFLMDGIHGFRFEAKSPVKLQTGELVEVVGFPDLSGPSPILREALVHPTGKADLPAARYLSEDAMLSGKLDATLVSIEARLVGLNAGHSEQTLELQAATRNYVARLANSRGTLPDILPGSLLELTGVYAGQGGDRASSRDIDSFELLLNSPSDIRVLARPSWWTLRHIFTVIGGMVFVILAALVWITLLRRQIEERTLQLTAEIKSREQAEHQHALEAERARIAQDLHDDLGATLTEIRFLSAVKSRDALVPQATRSQLREVSEKSRQMVSSLDEIVWAVNPANDFLPSLASYLRHVAEEFFRTTEVRCRLDVDESLPSVALTSEVRHNLYLVVREALNNIAKHSQATEAWLRIHWKDQSLHIVVEDNGSGFAGPGIVSSGNGLPNMHRRLEKIGGRFECDTRPGSGTVCRIHLPFK